MCITQQLIQNGERTIRTCKNEDKTQAFIIQVTFIHKIHSQNVRNHQSLVSYKLFNSCVTKSGFLKFMSVSPTDPGWRKKKKTEQTRDNAVNHTTKELKNRSKTEDHAFYSFI